MRCLAVPALCFVLFLALYLLAVRTSLGQRIDSAPVYRHNLDRTPDDQVWVADKVLFATVAFLVPFVLWFGRARMRVLMAIVLGLGTTIVLATGGQHVLGRPMLREFDPLYGKSYPSGHSAGTMALGLALVLVVPRLRWARGLAAFVPATVALMLLAFPIHRPSDIIAGFAIALAVMWLVGLAVTYWDDRRGIPRDVAGLADPASMRSFLVALARGVLTFVALLGVETLALDVNHFTLGQLGPSFPIALGVVVISAELVVAGYASAIRHGFGWGTEPPDQ